MKYEMEFLFHFIDLSISQTSFAYCKGFKIFHNSSNKYVSLSELFFKNVYVII